MRVRPLAALARRLARVSPAVLALAAACSAVPRAPEPSSIPSLAQIFAGAELLDKRPELLALAADGSSVVVRWSAGIPIYDHTDGVLRVIATAGARADERCGVELAQLLPAPPQAEFGPGSAPASQPSRAQREPSAWTYDIRGGALFVARGSGLWRVDPVHRVCTELLPERRRSSAESANAAAGALGDIERLAWSGCERPAGAGAGAFGLAEPLGRDLLVQDDDDAFVLPSAVARLGRDVGPAALRWLDEPLSARPRDVQWSDALSVAFAASGLRRAQAESEPADLPAAEIWRADAARYVTLAGFADLEGRDEARLAPDGSWVFALVRDKSRQKPPIPIPDYLTERVSTSDGRRETAEDGPSAVRMFAWDAESGERSELGFCAPYDAGWYSVVGWEPDDAEAGGSALVVRWTAPDWSCQQYFRVQPRSWSELLFPRDCAPGWVGGPANRARRGPCTGYRFATERDGSSQLESYARVEGEIDDFDVLDEHRVLVEAVTRDPGHHELVWLDAHEARRIEQPSGCNEGARASLDGRTVAFVHESSGVPAEIWVSDPRGARALTRTAPAAFERVDWPRPARRAFRSADGTRVWANVWLPGASRAPCIVFVHGAGYLQNVTDSLTEYPLNWMFHARLARLGYAVVDVDYRGSRGYGREFRTAVKDRLGEKELEDIHAALEELGRAGAIDTARVALYGGSYGGFLTLMALFVEPGRWRAGAALRSVTDWRAYHPTYTQPRLGKPSEHPEAYARSSPIDHVDGLRDPLLLLHGLRDDNVFAQDTLRLVEALVLRGKSFELMLYPSQGHGYDSGPHWLDQYQRIERFLRKHLDERVARGTLDG